MPQTIDLFCHTIFFTNLSMFTSFSLQFLAKIERAYTPYTHDFPVDPEHSVPP